MESSYNFQDPKRWETVNTSFDYLEEMDATRYYLKKDIRENLRPLLDAKIQGVLTNPQNKETLHNVYICANILQFEKDLLLSIYIEEIKKYISLENQQAYSTDLIKLLEWERKKPQYDTEYYVTQKNDLDTLITEKDLPKMTVACVAIHDLVRENIYNEAVLGIKADTTNNTTVSQIAHHINHGFTDPKNN